MATRKTKKTPARTSDEIAPDVQVGGESLNQSLIVEEGALALGLILCDQILFSLFYQKKDLSLGMSVEQKLTFGDESKRVLVCTSRSVAKTVGIIGRVVRDIVTFNPNPVLRDDEILVTTPTEGQMTQLADRVFAKVTENILFRSLIKTLNRRGDAPKIVTVNGLTVHFRIEGGVDDRNMTGPHPHKIYSDESAFSNELCHRSRAGGAKPHCKWFYAGVPNGVRDTPFYRLDQTHEGDGWSRHKYSMITANPMYSRSPAYAKEMEDLFGGKFSPDYHTQVEGNWGSEAMATFTSGNISFNKTVGQPDGYKYYIARASSHDVEKALNANKLYELLRIPSISPLRCVIGWDYGQSPDPSTFIIATQEADGAPWKTYARIALYGVVPPKQLEVMDYIFDVICNRRCLMISVDNRIIYHDLLDDDRRARYEGRVKLTQFNATVEIDMMTGRMVTDANRDDPAVLEHRKQGKIVKDWRKYMLTEMFKRMMLNMIYDNTSETRLELGYDAELESELLGTIERRTESHVVYDVPRSKSNKNNPKPDQACDAMRAVTDCILTVEAEMPQAKAVDTSELIAAMGWSKIGSPVGNRNDGNARWRQPWTIR